MDIRTENQNTLTTREDDHKKETVLCPLCGHRTEHMFRHGTTILLEDRDEQHWTESECQECGHTSKQYRMKAGHT